MNKARRFLVVFGGATAGYNWYVDGDVSSSGDGKSLVGAFKTVAEAESAMSAGQSVWIEPLDDGSPYRESLDLSALTGCRVYSSLVLSFTRDAGGYITGYTIDTAGGKIDCRDIIANATFSKTGGQTNVYEKSVTFDTSVTDPQVKIWEDGTPLTLVADVTTCDSTAGSYYIADHTSSPQTIYAHASDSSDITANSKQYEYNSRESAIKIGANSTISGVHCYANLSGNGSIIAGDNLTASNFICEQGTKHNMYHSETWSISDAVLKNAYWYSTGGTMMVYNKGVATGQHGTYTRVLAITDDGLGDNISGFHGHVNASGLFGNITFNDCSSVGFSGVGASGWQCTDAANIYLIDCLMSECTYGWNLYDSDPTYHIQDCKYYNSSAGARAVQFGVNGAKLNITNFDVDVQVNSSYGLALIGANTPTIIIDGLTITGKAGQTYAIRHTGTGGTISVTGSTFDTLYRFYHTNSGSMAITSDYNNFAQDMASYIQGTAYANVADYKTATGQDANSTVGA